MKPGRCRRCGSNMVFEDYGVKKCIACGHEVIYNSEKHQMIERHADLIATDYMEIGRRATLKKWSLSSKTLYRIPEVRRIILIRTIRACPVEEAIPVLISYLKSNSYTPPD